MRRLTTLIVILLILTSASLIEGQKQAIVKVVDPLGNPIDGVDVILEREGERFRFQTNSTGYAIFLNLPEGVYDVKVMIGDVAVAEGTLNYPSQDFLELTAQIATLNLTVLNMDNEPVQGVRVIVENRDGRVNSSVVTEKGGKAVLLRIPYSSIQEIGAYKIRFVRNDVELLAKEINISEPEIRLNVTLPLIRVNMTVTNLEGEPVKGVRITLKSGNLTFSEAAPDGVAEFVNIPSSNVPDVGEYLLNITMRTRAGDIPIHVEKRMLTESQHLDVLTELGRLQVRVVDEDGKPVIRVLIQLSNDLVSNFTLTTTDINGTAVFRNIPLSTGKASAGEYLIQAIRQGVLIGELRTFVDSPNVNVELRVKRAQTRIILRDFEGGVMDGYDVILRDEATGESFEATTGKDGSIRLRLFFGTYSIEVKKNDRTVFDGVLAVRSNEEELKVDSVNFPYRVELKDSFGASLRGIILRVNLDDILLHEAPYQEPVVMRVPYPGRLRVEVLRDGDILHRETLLVDGPGGQAIRLQSYIVLGDSIIALEDLGFAIALAASLAIIGLSAFYLRRGLRRRRES